MLPSDFLRLQAQGQVKGLYRAFLLARLREGGCSCLPCFWPLFCLPGLEAEVFFLLCLFFTVSFLGGLPL